MRPGDLQASPGERLASFFVAAVTVRNAGGVQAGGAALEKAGQLRRVSERAIPDEVSFRLKVFADTRSIRGTGRGEAGMRLQPIQTPAQGFSLILWKRVQRLAEEVRGHGSLHY